MRPVNQGCSAPNSSSLTSEWTPSAATTPSCTAVLPSAKPSSTDPALASAPGLSSSPVSLWSSRMHSVGTVAYPLLQAQPAQHLYRVAADLDARAEPGELPRLLVDRDVDAGPEQRGRRGEAAHSSADHGDGKPGSHSASGRGA